MNDLISRQDAINAIEETDWYHINKYGELVQGANSQEHEPLYKANDIFNALKKLPSVQPERKTGKWILDNLNNGYGMVYHCTECNWLTTNPQYAYCPNCGAKMEGQDDK